MEPIISPWLIWLLGVLNALKLVSIIFFIIGVLSLIIIISILLAIREDLETTIIKLFNKTIKALIIFTSISMLSVLFVPDKGIAEKMIISNYITEDNINTVSENTKEAIDYIFDKIEGLTNENNNQNKTESAS